MPNESSSDVAAVLRSYVKMPMRSSRRDSEANSGVRTTIVVLRCFRSMHALIASRPPSAPEVASQIQLLHDCFPSLTRPFSLQHYHPSHLAVLRRYCCLPNGDLFLAEAQRSQPHDTETEPFADHTTASTIPPMCLLRSQCNVREAQPLHSSSWISLIL